MIVIMIKFIVKVMRKRSTSLGTYRENNSSAGRLFKEKGWKVAFEPGS